MQHTAFKAPQTAGLQEPLILEINFIEVYILFQLQIEPFVFIQKQIIAKQRFYLDPNNCS